MWKKVLIALVAILVLIQFIKPERNLSGDETYGIKTKYAVPDDVERLLKAGCYDCHSNKTEYPWYANFQPSAWWLAQHVKEGKEHLNLSEFTNQPLAVQHHKFDEIIEMVKEKEMPLPSYTWFGLHPEANYTDAERQVITVWAQAQMDDMKAKYPADSLVLKRRPNTASSENKE